MKKLLPITKILVVILTVLSFVQQSNAQAFMTENFDYPASTLLTNAGWSAHSGQGSQAVDIVVPGLSFAGYPLSNIGGAAVIDNNGEDVNKTFSVQSSGKVYAAFMVKVTGAADGYFLHLGGDPIGTTFRGKLFTTGTTDPFNFGLSVGANTATNVNGGAYNFNKTYLFVLKYEIIDGEKNDAVSLYIISGAVPATEPATPSVGPLTDASQTDINPGSIALRQYSATQNITVDGIRFAKTWSEAVTAGLSADNTPPVFTAGYPKITNINATKADLQVNMDEAGRAFYLVVPDGAATPTTAQVIAGNNYGSVTKAASGNVEVDAGGTIKTVTISGLTDKTNYDVYVVAQDDETTPNKQSAPVLINLYTIRPPDVILGADFNTSLSPFTQVSLTGDAVWDMYTITTENKCPKMSGYVSSTYYENIDYLISPLIDLSASETNKMSFTSAKSYTGPAMKVMISSDFSGTYNATAVKAATWTDITSNFTYSPESFTFTPSGELSLAAYTGKVYIAFVYESTLTQAATWEIDDFLVTGYKKSTGNALVREDRISLYPIPARDVITFCNMEEVNWIEIFDINGKLQAKLKTNGESRVQYDVSGLSPGVFLVRISRNGTPVILKFTRE